MLIVTGFSQQNCKSFVIAIYNDISHLIVVRKPEYTGKFRL